MQEEEQRTIALEIRSADADSLTELIKPTGLCCTMRGFIGKSVTISGPAAAVNAFEPALRRWQLDCESRDAW